jgi:hypothetical protein
VVFEFVAYATPQKVTMQLLNATSNTGGNRE